MPSQSEHQLEKPRPRHRFALYGAMDLKPSDLAFSTFLRCTRFYRNQMVQRAGRAARLVKGRLCNKRRRTPNGDNCPLTYSPQANSMCASL